MALAPGTEVLVTGVGVMVGVRLAGGKSVVIEASGEVVKVGKVGKGVNVGTGSVGLATEFVGLPVLSGAGEPVGS